MRIRTEFVHPPIPDRRFDWTAIDDDTHDGPGSPIGFGPTAQAAIDDFREAIELRYDPVTVSTAIALHAWSACTGTEFDCRLAWANAARAHGL